MKTILTKHENGDYELRTPKGETWHLEYPYVKNRYKRISTNPDFVMTGKIVRGGIPDFLKSVVFEILKNE